MMKHWSDTKLAPWRHMPLCLFGLALALTLAAARPTQATDWTTTSASASSQLWSVNNAYDNNTVTNWSSNTHTTANNVEWISYWWSGFQNVNYVKLLPRYLNGSALGFPVNFIIYYSNGSSWVQVGSYTSYPKPNRGDWIVIPLPGTYSANGIYIYATTLGQDDIGNYIFQLAEAKAGYDAGFNQFTYTGNNAGALPGKTQISGVVPNAFNPNRLSNWNYDERDVVIAPNPGTYRNIYSPQAVFLGGNTWRIYFHGYDGISAPVYDRIYTTVSFDDFMNFDTHYLQIDHGIYGNVGNESVVWVGPNDWRMAYTCMRSDLLNKTGYATSTDGANWTPNAGSASYMFNMTGYANWAAGDFNGVNPIIKDAGGTWHYYFMDSRYNAGVEHATGTDGVNFTYQNRAQAYGIAMNDIKAFTYGGTTYYAACYHTNNNNMWMTCGTSLSNLGTATLAFNNHGSADLYMPTCGWVQDGVRLYGMLYGGCAVSSLDQNRIFARWLQKKVVFQNSYVTWNLNTGFGMRNSRLAMSGSNVETGNFKVYDTDGTTLLYTSPLVTLRVGDLWNYSGS